METLIGAALQLELWNDRMRHSTYCSHALILNIHRGVMFMFVIDLAMANILEVGTIEQGLID